jgi:signal transduction histidine kinase
VPSEDVPVGADLRRQVFLIYKECVHNAARHSGCTEAEATVRVDDGALLVTFRDDGKGFDSGGAHDGHGLPSMQDRARRLGGRLEITSDPGRGTTVALSVPLAGAHGRPHLRRW